MEMSCELSKQRPGQLLPFESVTVSVPLTFVSVPSSHEREGAVGTHSRRAASPAWTPGARDPGCDFRVEVQYWGAPA